MTQLSVETDGTWYVKAGDTSRRPVDTWVGSTIGIENLTYSNPFKQAMERVWFDRRVVYAIELGAVLPDPRKNTKIAQEYQIVYDIALDADGLPIEARRKRVPGQLNIYDSVPGMPKYSPIWRMNYVVVPQGYVLNSLRSEQDVLNSKYQIVRSSYFVN